MNTKLLRQKVLDLAIHGKLLDKAVVEALETTPGYEPASKLLERIRGESLPLATAGKPSSAAPSAGSNAARNACSNPISEDEIPFEIPENWCWCRLSEIFYFIGGYAYKSSTFLKASNNQVLRLGNVKNDRIIYDTNPVFIPNELAFETEKFRCVENDILVTMTGTKGRRDYFFSLLIPKSNKNLFVNQRVGCLRPFLFSLSPYVNYALKCTEILDIIFASETGTANQGNLSAESINNLIIPLPPLEEQKLIVEEIERIFALIDTVEQNKTDLETVIKQTKSKILDLAIHGKLVPQDKTDEPASKMLEKLRAEKEEKIAKGQLKRDKNDSYIYKSANGKWLERKADGSEEEIEVPFEIPESWSWCKLKDIANIARGGSPRPIEDFITDDENGINWIKIGDTKDGNKYITTVREKIRPEGIKHSRFVHSGDFLLTNSMSFGRPYILKVDGCIHDGWLVFADIGKVIDSDFLYYSLSSDFIYTAFSFVAAGSTVKNLKSDTVKETLFPLPPLEEQKRMVQKIDDIYMILKQI